MRQAKNAIQLFIRSLPAGNLFNIIGFGSTSEKLFPNSKILDENTLNQADVRKNSILSHKMWSNNLKRHTLRTWKLI